jgi:hypothetical protein
MNCPKCATTLSAGAEFCGLCGSAAPVNTAAPNKPTVDKHNDASTELQSDLAAALAIGLQDEPTQLAPAQAQPKAAAAPISKAVPALSPASKSVPSLKEPTGKIRLPEAPVSKSVSALSPASKATPSLQAPPVSKSVPSLGASAVKEPTGKIKLPEAPVSKSVTALKEEAKPAEVVVASAKTRRRWKQKTVKLKKKLKELKAFRRGPQSTPPAAPVLAALQESAARPINRPTASPSQRDILLGINEKMNAVATMIRTGELQVVEEPDGGLPSMVESKASSASDYGALVSESSLKAVSRADAKKAPPPPPLKKAGDFEDFSAPATDLPKVQSVPVRINTLELEIAEDPSEKLASGYAAHVAPAPSAFKGIDSTVEPIVISSKPPQDSGEIALRKNANKSKTFMIAALALAAGAVGAFALAPKSDNATIQSVAAAAPPITVQPTLVTVSNDEKISQAAALAVQGKWDEAAVLAEAAQSPDLAKRYRIEGEVSQNLKDCRAARDEKKLEVAMAACHLVEIVEGSQSAQIAIPEIEKLKKEYKTKHVPITKKGISRNTTASLSEAKQEIELLALYLGEDHTDVNLLEKLYQEQLKKLPGKEKMVAQNETSALSKTPTPTATNNDTKVSASLVPITPTPTAAITSGGPIYLVNGVYLSLGGFSNRTKDSALTAKYQSAISRSLSSSGKISAPPSGKDPITLLGAVTKSETKVSGGSTVITVSVSLQVTRNKAILAFLSKDASAEFSGSISPAEEKSGKDEVIKALADGIFVDLKKSLGKFK